MSEPGIVTRTAAFLLATILLSGCAAVPKRAAPAMEQGASHNLKGIHAEEQKIFKVAEAEFAEAYRLYSSVENYHGMVTALVNSSRLYRRTGRLQQAETVTERAVELGGNTPELASEVWFEKAKLLLLQNRNDEAALWCEKAVKAAPESEQPRMLNLSSEIYRNKGQRAWAGQFAEKALQLSRKSGDRQEEANALRNLGGLELIEKRPGVAVDQFKTALEIDKELALSRKISADLRALSQSFAAQGDTRAAAAYLQRAVDAELADGDRKQTVFDLETLGQLQERSGQSQAAAKTDELRRKLQQEQK